MRLPTAIVLSTLCLAACATTRLNDQQRLSIYTDNAGAPVKSIVYNEPISWERIDNDHLVLNTRPSEAYLFTLSGPCLQWGSSSPVVSISHQAGFVSAGLDRVSFSFDRASFPEPSMACRISEIRPVNVAGVRASRDALAATP
jgi:hypothetical protein